MGAPAQQPCPDVQAERATLLGIVGDGLSINTRTPPTESCAGNHNYGSATVEIAAPIVTPYMQLTLLGSALLGLLLVILVFANDTSPWKDLLSRGALHLLQNFGVAFLFFFSSDIAAQLLPWIRSHALPMTWLLLLPRVWLNLGREFVEQVNVKWSRACRSGALGIMINGLGYYAWVHALNKLIPQKDLDLDHRRLHALGLLIFKSLLDSCLWGTTSNSVGIVGRRLLEGDEWEHAVKVWEQKILEVTVWELRFWPFWSAAQFFFLPAKLQVMFTSLGAFIWNCYLSHTSLKEPVEKQRTNLNLTPL